MATRVSGSATTLTKTGLNGSQGFKIANGIYNNPNLGKGSGAIVNTKELWYHNGANTTMTFNSNNYYTFNVVSPGTSNTHVAILETTYNPTGISSISPTAPTGIYAQQSVSITANLTAAPNADEKFYIRYTTNNWVASNLVAMIVSGTTATASIPGQNASTVAYYVLSTNTASATALTTTPADADFYTLKISSGGGYTVGNTYGAINTGDWSNTATWANGSVPPAGSAVTIANNVTLDGAQSVSSITINSGATLDCSSNTLTINAGGTLTNNGTFERGTGKVAFSGIGTVNGTVGFNNVDISGGVNFGTGSTVNGTLSFKSGAFVNINAPSYATGSTLEYTANYTNAAEWNNIPHNLTISSGTVIFNNATVRTINGNLTIALGATLTLSSTFGGDFTLKGNFTNNGTLTHNSRQVEFNGSATQTISGTDVSFPFLKINNGNGVSLSSATTVTNTLTLTSGKITLGANNLTIGSSGAIADASASNYIVTNGAGKLVMNVTNAGKTFPIGASATSYDPATITPATTSDVSVKVSTTFSNTVSDQSKVVSREWDITPTAASNTTIALTHNASLTAPSSGIVKIGHFTNGSWSESDVANPTYNAETRTYTGTVSSFSPFGGGVAGGFASVLAANFKTLTAKKAQNQNALTWATASEANIANYAVERSRDSRNWETIGNVAAKNAANGADYSFNDNKVVAGTTYYRIRIEEYSGAVTYSKVVSVKSGFGTLSAYPNPVKSVLTIETDSYTEGGMFEVVDIAGRTVLQQNIGNQLDVSALNAGVYQLKMIDKAGQTLQQVRFVKE